VGAIFSKQKPADVFTRSSFQLNLHLLMYLSSNQQAKEFIITRTRRRHGCEACHLGDSDVTPEEGECHCVSFMTDIYPLLTPLTDRLL